MEEIGPTAKLHSLQWLHTRYATRPKNVFSHGPLLRCAFLCSGVIKPGFPPFSDMKLCIAVYFSPNHVVKIGLWVLCILDVFVYLDTNVRVFIVSVMYCMQTHRFLVFSVL